MSDVMTKLPDCDVMEIMKLIPHRYPFLLIDKLTDVVSSESAVGVKNVTVNEQFFNGHFPGNPIFPGVLMVEAMAQTAAALVMKTLGLEAEKDSKTIYFMSINDTRFRKPVRPGDVLHLHVTKEKERRNIWKFKGVGKVEGQNVVEATFTAMIADVEE